MFKFFRKKSKNDSSSNLLPKLRNENTSLVPNNTNRLVSSPTSSNFSNSSKPKDTVFLFALKYTCSLLFIALIIASITHSRPSIADGNKTKEQIEHVQFKRLTLKGKINITSKKIKEAFKGVPTYKKLNRDILYESNSIVNSVIGWNAGPINHGQTFYLSLPTKNANECAKDKVEVATLPQVKRVDCRPGKMFVIFKEEEKK